MPDIDKINGDGRSLDLPLPLKMIIYKVTNLVNNKVYIGKTKNSLSERKRRHLSDAKSDKYNMVFHKALRKYNEDDFVWEILDAVMFSDLLTDLEKFYIKKYNSKIPYGYNMTDGGDGVCGFARSKETKCRIREKLFGNKNSIGKKNRLGRHHSEETKGKIRESLIGRHPWNYGKHMSDYGRRPWNYGNGDPTKRSHHKKINTAILPEQMENCN